MIKRNKSTKQRPNHHAMNDLINKLSALDVDDKIEYNAQTALLHPKLTSQCDVRDTGSATDYVKACLQNVLAEYWGFVMKSTGDRPGWMRKLLKRVVLSVKDNDVKGVVKDEYGDGEEEIKLEELAWNLVVSANQLCLLKPVRDGGGEIIALSIVKGMELKKLNKVDSAESFHSSKPDAQVFFIMGYIRTYYVDMLAAMEFIRDGESKMPAVLACVANPNRRTPFVYNTGAHIDTSNIGCNAVQEGILRSMTTNIEGIQGPPGTGKSTTIFHILNSLILDAALVTCVQNKAVDSIAEKLATSTVEFVVLGRAKNLGPSAAQFTMEERVKRDAGVVRAKARLASTTSILSRLIKKLETKEKSRFGPVHVAVRRKLWGRIDTEREKEYNKDDFIHNSPWRRWWKAFVAERSGLGPAIRFWSVQVLARQADMVKAKQWARGFILSHSKAVLCTIDTASALLHEDNQLATPITVAILDEAGTIPEFKMPLLAKLGVSAIIAIGDQKQLQPFSHVDDPRRTPSGYFHRLARVLPRLPMLKTQYRMHPQLCSIVSGAFYNGQISTDPGIAAKRIAAAGPSGVAWISYDDAQAESSGRFKRTSKWNPTEVDIIESFLARAGVADLLLANKTIMVISFYKEQTKALQRMAETYGFQPTDQRFRIVTVDAAQGSEADIVILSCVRSNAEGDIGFVSNANRMCVAISRAKERLVIVGDSKTFRRRPGPWRGVCAEARVGTSIECAV